MSYSRFITKYARFALIAVVAVTVALPRPAAAADDRWKLRLDGTWTNSGGSLSIGSWFDFGISLSSGSSAGIGGALEYRVSPLIGAEVSVLYTRTDLYGISASGFRLRSSTGSRSFVPISAALNLHLLRKERVDLYVGPMLTYSIFGKADADNGSGRSPAEASSGFGLGAQVGVDVALGEGAWGLGGSVRYTMADADVAGGIPFLFEANFNPVTVTAGLRYRF